MVLRTWCGLVRKTIFFDELTIMFAVASATRPSIVVSASSGDKRKGKRIPKAFKNVKKDLDKLLVEAKASYAQFEKMHTANVDKLREIADRDIDIVKEAFADEKKKRGSSGGFPWPRFDPLAPLSSKSDDDEDADAWFDPVSTSTDSEGTIDVNFEYVPHADRGRNDK